MAVAVEGIRGCAAGGTGAGEGGAGPARTPYDLSRHGARGRDGVDGAQGTASGGECSGSPRGVVHLWRASRRLGVHGQGAEALTVAVP